MQNAVALGKLGPGGALERPIFTRLTRQQVIDSVVLSCGCRAGERSKQHCGGCRSSVFAYPMRRSVVQYTSIGQAEDRYGACTLTTLLYTCFPHIAVTRRNCRDTAGEAAPG
ncbi:hypothetical protein BaRGS_00001579 [Batillaria attramentaria]|uniref:Uncharacterized protein n=1 Tax=Batillaria attramentaria TaxID=370345 RepID=A0ABD0M782_9CAEN